MKLPTVYVEDGNSMLYCIESVRCDNCQRQLDSFFFLHIGWLEKRRSQSSWIKTIGTCCADNFKPEFADVNEVYKVTKIPRILRASRPFLLDKPAFTYAHPYANSFAEIIDNTHHAGHEGYTFDDAQLKGKDVWKGEAILDQQKQIEVRENVARLDAPVNDIDAFLLGVKDSVPLIENLSPKLGVEPATTESGAGHANAPPFTFEDDDDDFDYNQEDEDDEE